MNFARKTDKVFTIIYTIISILSIIILIMTHIYPDKFFNNLYESFSAINNKTFSINNLFNLIGHIYMGSTSIVLLYILAVLAVIIGLPVTVITIFAYIGIILYKATNNPKHIRRNLIVKIIYTRNMDNAIALIMTIKDIGFVVVFAITCRCAFNSDCSCLWHARARIFFGILT